MLTFFLAGSTLPVIAADPELDRPHLDDCGFQSQDKVRAALSAAIAAGQIEDPAKKVLPVVRPRTVRGGVAAVQGAPIVTPDDLYFFEDTGGLLLTNFSDGQLFNMMADATNAVLVDHGDNFDFIGFFLNFVPDHQIGGAFYLGLENDVTGIGRPPFNQRAALGVAGANVEGWVMMWNQASWSPGSATITQLVLGQEFEHRFAMFLSPMSGGRALQGDNGSCGRGAHWNFRVDGQGSGMEIADWIGSAPATRSGGTLSFNTDIGGVFSYVDLYLMGYVSASELDTVAIERRYLDNN